jgi:hypothetical protein
MSLTVEQLTDGIRYWRTTDWPQDFHNSYYAQVLSGVRITNATFDLSWWNRFYPILHDWRATRPASRVFLTTRVQERFEQLGKAWSSVIAPNLPRDIETLEWDQIAAFPLVVVEIKPLKYSSPVFTSKFCHFLAPRIFPIVDNKAMGNPFMSYEAYFTTARGEWLSTDSAIRAELINHLTQAIGAPLSCEFPMKCKLIELCLIGRYKGT